MIRVVIDKGVIIDLPLSTFMDLEEFEKDIQSIKLTRQKIKEKAYNKKYAQTHKDNYRKYAEKYRRTHKEQIKEHYIKNRDVYLAKSKLSKEKIKWGPQGKLKPIYVGAINSYNPYSFGEVKIVFRKKSHNLKRLLLLYKENFRLGYAIQIINLMYDCEAWWHFDDYDQVEKFLERIKSVPFSYLIT